MTQKLVVFDDVSVNNHKQWCFSVDILKGFPLLDQIFGQKSEMWRPNIDQAFIFEKNDYETETRNKHVLHIKEEIIDNDSLLIFW